MRDDVTHDQLAIARRVLHHLSLTLSLWGLRQGMNAARKDLRSVQGRLDRNMVAGSKVSESALHSITVHLGPLVEEYLHRPPAKDGECELVANPVQIANPPANDRALPAR